MGYLVAFLAGAVLATRYQYEIADAVVRFVCPECSDCEDDGTCVVHEEV